ncbi:MAG TPA: SDR family NAD(P)-dependent oxidoreductase [Actinocrinis sp.]|jgi:3-oxoacyl-[acyl-carrier protein] reductase
MGAARYAGRVVAVTGAGQGLGYAMARRFAAEGAVVAACDINPGPLSELAKGGADDESEPITTAVVDVTSTTQVDAWIDQVVSEHARVDVLINNAGIIRDNRLERQSDQDWSAVVEVSLRGAFVCSRAAFRHMKQHRYGRILSLSSMSWRGNFGQANYAAAKAGVIGLARTIAIEGAPLGITSNVIAPGLIETPMLRSMDSRGRDRLTARIPVGHTGRPDDIAEAAAFLCSESAGYITGVVLDVDGGINVNGALR